MSIEEKMNILKSQLSTLELEAGKSETDKGMRADVPETIAVEGGDAEVTADTGKIQDTGPQEALMPGAT